VRRSKHLKRVRQQKLSILWMRCAEAWKRSVAAVNAGSGQRQRVIGRRRKPVGHPDTRRRANLSRRHRGSGRSKGGSAAARRRGGGGGGGARRVGGRGGGGAARAPQAGRCAGHSTRNSGLAPPLEQARIAEAAPAAHSITSSARARSVGGNSRARVSLSGAP